jgi:hypothetical protein
LLFKRKKAKDAAPIGAKNQHLALLGYILNSKILEKYF